MGKALISTQMEISTLANGRITRLMVWEPNFLPIKAQIKRVFGVMASLCERIKLLLN